MAEPSKFKPDWYSRPSETINDLIELKGLNSNDLALAFDRSQDWVDRLLAGDLPISEEIASVLEASIGGTADFWVNRQALYDQEFARVTGAVVQFSEEAWLASLPLKEMKRFGWIDPTVGKFNLFEACLEFFGVPNLATWQSTYGRKIVEATFQTSPTYDSAPESVAAWLRKGEIEADQMECAPWNTEKFRDILAKCRGLTRLKRPSTFIPKLQELCAECGVAVVVVRTPSGCRASGATRFLSPERAVLQLSFRFLSDDHFWFTFFHEAAHLLLHGDRSLILEGADLDHTQQEEEANQFAFDMLIPREVRSEFDLLEPRYKSVIRFAVRAGISPGIVVGQMQHAGHIMPNQLNKVKRRYKWVDA